MGKLFAVIFVLATGVLSVATCQGQSWRDPALQQPLPQFYPANRYPLGNGDKVDLLPNNSTKRPVTISDTLSTPAQTPKSTQRDATPASPVRDKKTNDAPTAKPLKSTTSKPQATKKTAAKPKTKKTPTAKKTKPENKTQPVINYDIYRDRAAYPIDPRKPCSTCRRPVGKCSCGRSHGQCSLGNQGQPYQDREPGGYPCGKNCPNKRPTFSVYWPRPFSARPKEGHPHRCNCDSCTPRINDRFDHLASFKLIDYQRTDNGYCGPGADPYGCLGESKHQMIGPGM